MVTLLTLWIEKDKNTFEMVMQKKIFDGNIFFVAFLQKKPRQ